MAFNQGIYDEVAGLLGSGRSQGDISAIINGRLAETGQSRADLADALGIGAGQVNQYLGANQQVMPQNPTQQGYTRSPYLDQIANSITQQATRNLQENILPGVRSNSIAAGNFGGSRQGIAEGLAVGRTNDALTSSLANLYNTDYQAQMNRNLQQYGMDQQYALGQGQLGLGYAGLDNQYNIANMNNSTQRYGIDQNYGLGMTNANNTRYGIDKGYEANMAQAGASQAQAAAQMAYNQGRLALDQDQFGFNSALQLQQFQNAMNNGALGGASAIQNTPYNYWNQYGQGINSIANGYGSSTSSSSGNPAASLLGASQLVGSYANNYNNGWNSMPNRNVYMGTGSMGD